MAESLRDQLVKAGLASAAQARKAERQTRAEKNAQRQDMKSDPSAGSKSNQGRKGKAKSRPPDANSPAVVKERARKQQASKRARDQALARNNNEKTASRALRAEIKQIILQNDQRTKAVADDDVPYNFVHGKKIKKIFVPRKQLDLLSSGHLVIVNNDGLYHLISSEAAEQVRERDPKRIIAAHADKPAEPGSDDEHYGKFQVPDDLDW